MEWLHFKLPLAGGERNSFVSLDEDHRLPIADCLQVQQDNQGQRTTYVRNMIQNGRLASALANAD
jgi:hypothetical protein